MIRIDFEDQDLKKMEKDFQNYFESFPLRLKHIQQIFYQNVRALTPVDTGYMKSRWKKEPLQKDFGTGTGNLMTSVSNDTYYLPYVNEGHKTSNGKSYVPGKFFIQKAIRLTNQRIQREMKP